MAGSDNTIEIRIVTKDDGSAAIQLTEQHIKQLADTAARQFNIVKDSSEKAEQGIRKLGTLGGVWDSFKSQMRGAANVGLELLESLEGLQIAFNAIVGVVGRAAGALFQWTLEGSKAAGVAEGFAIMTARAGVNAGDMVAEMKAATGGMLDTSSAMQQFNLAASLVGDDFARKLPESMALLGSISLATGEDLGFLTQSIIRGVGRVQPLILDNLGVQVSLNEAFEEYAELHGGVATGLSKTEQQTAIFEATMRRLQDRFGELPSVTETAAGRFIAMQATFTDLKNEIGMALAPALSELMLAFSEFAKAVLPSVVKFFEGTLAPAFETIADAIGHFVGAIAGGGDPVVALGIALRELGFGDLADNLPGVVSKIKQFADGFADLVDTVVNSDLVQSIKEWWQETVKAKDVLIILGAAIGGVVIAVLGEFLLAVAAIGVAIAGAIAIVAALRTAWETDWLGIRTAITTVWEKTIRPILEAIGSVITTVAIYAIDKLGQAIGGLRKAWDSDFGGIRSTVEDAWNNVLLPSFGAMALFLTETLPDAVQVSADWFNNEFGPAMDRAIQNVDDTRMALADFAIGVADAITTAKEKIADFVSAAEGVAAGVQGAFDFVIFGDFTKEFGDLFGLMEDSPFVETFLDIREKVIGALGAIADFISSNLTAAFSTLSAIANATVVPVFNAIVTAAQGLATFVTGTLIPAIQSIAEWFGVNVLPVLATFGEFITSIVNLALAALGALIRGVVLPVLIIIGQKIKEVTDFLVMLGVTIVGSILVALAWLGEKITAVSGFISDLATKIVGVFITAFEQAGTFISTIFQPVIDNLHSFFAGSLMPIFERISEFVSGVFSAAFGEAGSLIGENFKGSVEKASGVLEIIEGVLARVKDMVSNLIGLIDTLAAKLNSVQVPPALQPGSPSPLEWSIIKPRDLMEDMSMRVIPRFDSSLNALRPPNLGGPAAFGGGAVGMGAGTSPVRIEVVNVMDGNEFTRRYVTGTLAGLAQQGVHNDVLGQ